MTSVPVTPTLFVGDRPALQDAYEVDTVSEAVQLIRVGLVAVLPADAWDLVEDTLRAVTDDHEAITRALSFARTGRIDTTRCPCPACEVRQSHMRR
jgi:hypothetical protein